MMRVRRPRELEDAEVIIIPMIDTMMFLLMVFIVASLALAVQLGLPITLPKASTAVQHQAQNVTITVTGAQQVYVNMTPTQIADVTGRLQALHVTEGTDVIMNIDQTVPYGTLVTVMDDARKDGAARFEFATKNS